MSDSITGVNITPRPYPVKPAQPSERDNQPGNRRSGNRSKDAPEKKPKENSHFDDEDNKSVIDEYI